MLQTIKTQGRPFLEDIQLRLEGVDLNFQETVKKNQVFSPDLFFSVRVEIEIFETDHFLDN